MLLTTHTGRPIVRDYPRFVVRCGGFWVAERDLAERRPGRARQMARMIAKARRRARRRPVAWLLAPGGRVVGRVTSVRWFVGGAEVTAALDRPLPRGVTGLSLSGEALRG